MIFNKKFRLFEGLGFEQRIEKTETQNVESPAK